MNVLLDIFRVAYLGRVVAGVADANIAVLVSRLPLSVYNPEPRELLADVENAWRLELNPFTLQRCLKEIRR